MNFKGRLTPAPPAGLLAGAAALLMLLLLAPAASAQAKLGEAAARQLRAQAEECNRAFVEGDFGRLADYTYPKLVTLLGGREKMVDYLRKSVAEMKADGFEPLSYAPSEPTQVLRAGRETYAVVPATLRMRAPDGVLVSESFMIAVSADGGKTWKFLSGGSATPAQLRALLPRVAGRLRPPAPAPVRREPAP
ncbi:MAG TPA: hypothetical protein VF668_14275 [Pyrinomonadaceae bacterium]|jgi:hypothetical protein